MNPLDAIPDYESAWKRLKVDLHDGTANICGADAYVVLSRMDQIEAFVTVTAMLKLHKDST